MRNLRYETRLAKWGINRHEDRRVRRDLIEMYKSVNGVDEINWERNPVVDTPKVGVLTRSNGVKIRKEYIQIKDNYFLDRITPTWNDFPKKIV